MAWKVNLEMERNSKSDKLIVDISRNKQSSRFKQKGCVRMLHVFRVINVLTGVSILRFSLTIIGN